MLNANGEKNLLELLQNYCSFNKRSLKSSCNLLEQTLNRQTLLDNIHIYIHVVRYSVYLMSAGLCNVNVRFQKVLHLELGGML